MDLLERGTATGVRPHVAVTNTIDHNTSSTLDNISTPLTETQMPTEVTTVATSWPNPAGSVSINHHSNQDNTNGQDMFQQGLIIFNEDDVPEHASHSDDISGSQNFLDEASEHGSNGTRHNGGWDDDNQSNIDNKSKEEQDIEEVLPEPYPAENPPQDGSKSFLDKIAIDIRLKV
jgi:hypothetical protein